MKKGKILVVGPSFYGYCKSIGSAFEKEGFKVELIEWVEKGVENFKEKLLFNLHRDKTKFFDRKTLLLNERIRTRFDAFNPDHVLVVRGSLINEETLNHMRPTPVSLWMMDTIFSVPETLARISFYQHIFLFEKADIEPLAVKTGYRGNYLSLALDESVYFPLESNKKEIDILFVGALYPDRVAVLNRLIKYFPGKVIKIYGSYFSPLRNLKKFLFRKDKQYYTNKTLPPQELNKLYSKARVCINIHHKQSVYGVNQRFFELIGAKALQVCDKRGFISDHFSEDSILYETEQELFDQVEACLRSPGSFENRKQSLYEKVLKDHTFRNRIQEIIKVAGIESKTKQNVQH